MSLQLQAAPWSFWLHLVVLGGLVFEAISKWREPWSKPALAIYGTVSFWYSLDFVFSEPIDYRPFAPEVVGRAFLQVCLFLVAFRLFLSGLSRSLCRRPLQDRRAYLEAGGTDQIGKASPKVFTALLFVLIVAWVGIFAIGAVTSRGQWAALIWPPLLPEKVGMYPLTGLGSGASFLFNAIGYLHILVCALLGLIVVTGRGATRWIAAGMVLLTWPYFWFDRTRNKMLALLLPGFAAFLLDGRRPLPVRVGISVLVVALVGFWFARVAEYRTSYDLAAFTEAEEEGMDAEMEERVRRNARQGQDMLKELCWVNTMLESGRYEVNWGRRYFAELVNPIPRTFWAGKPMVGIDYAIARGFGGAKGGAGVYASVATGMIGQGCVNFGQFFGVLAAAFFFALWAAFLARLWCQRQAPLRFFLFLIGLGLTFNSGRDLTFLVLFPFAFGWIALFVFEWLRTVQSPARIARAAVVANARTREAA